MLKLDDRNLIVGEIKQILHTFNLPLCRMDDKFPAVGRHFIKNSTLMIWEQEGNEYKAKALHHYQADDALFNLTTTLPIDNNFYDRNTHRYLGRYLRFLKSYYNLDLLSMYNYFDGQTISYDIYTEKHTFAANSKNTVCYKVPINENIFTIKSFSRIPIHSTLFVDNETSSDNKYLQQILNDNYGVFDFSKPKQINFIEKAISKIEKMTAEDKKYYRQYLEKNISDIYLILEIPKSFNNSIVILEGQYVDSEYDLDRKMLIYFDNTEFVGDAELRKTDKSSIRVSSYKIIPQLLTSENAKSRYLVADRLLEYLTHNAITPLNNDYEISRAQYALSQHLYKQDPDLKIYPKYRGIWDDSTLVAGRIAVRKTADKNGLNLYSMYDTLGYLDKDLENIIAMEDMDSAKPIS